MKKTIHWLAAVSCFALSASWSHAAPMAHDMQGAMGEQMADMHFKEMDTNSDATISKAEFDAVHDKHFQDMDTNGDSKLTRDEMKAGHKQMLKAGMHNRFDEADANHDGALSREEAEKMPRMSKRFDKMDTNKDGKLTREEMAAAMKKKRPNRE